jgi:hypothetical protein
MQRTKCDQTERTYWTLSNSFGESKPPTGATRTGISSMKNCSILNERMAIVSCQAGKTKTGRLGIGLLSREGFIQRTKCDQTERIYWTNSSSYGELKSPTTKTSNGNSSMKSWSSLNERTAIVWCQKGTIKTRLLGIGFVNSGAYIIRKKNATRPKGPIGPSRLRLET